MHTLLDCCDDLLSFNLIYDQEVLKVFCNGRMPTKGIERLDVCFTGVKAFFVLEEAVDAITYSGEIFKINHGFIKCFDQINDPAEPLLGLYFLMPKASLTHYRLITRDEVIHIICSSHSEVAVEITKVE